MKIVKYNSVDKEKWDSFVENNVMGNSFLLYDFVSLPMPRNSEKFENISFAIVDDTWGEKRDLLMIFQLQKIVEVRKKMFSKEIFVNFAASHGFCVKDGLSRKQQNELKDFFFEYLDNISAKNKLFIALCPFSNFVNPENITHVNPLINWGFQPSLGYTYIIDLQESAETIFSNYEQTTRNLISRTYKDNAFQMIKSDYADSDYEVLKQLNNKIYEKNNENMKLTDTYLQALWERLKSSPKIDLFFAKHEDKYVSYVILLYNNNCAYYLWGGGDHEYQSIHRRLLHEAILFAQNNGYRYFEVGQARPWLRAGKDKSISDYKKSFSHTLHPIYCGTYI